MAAATAAVSSSFVNPTSDEFKQRASNCVLLTITVICVCVLVVCGVNVVREYTLGKGYEAATCHVTKVSTMPHVISCSYCGTGAIDKTKEKGAGSCVPSSFPCLKVEVAYKAADRDFDHVGIVHPDSIQSNGIFGQCSWEICMKIPADNVRRVKDYSEGWQDKHDSQEKFDCFFNTEKPDDVIMEKKHTGNEVIHSIMWPSVVILVCGIIFLFLERKRGTLGNFCGDGMSKRGNADGAEEDNIHGSDTLLRWQQGKAECRLLQKDAPAACSMTALDRLKHPPESANGVPAPSRSFDGTDANTLINPSVEDAPRIIVKRDSSAKGHC